MTYQSGFKFSKEEVAFGLPLALADDGGEVIGPLYALQGISAQIELIATALPTLSSAVDSYCSHAMQGRLSKNNTHRLRQSLPYLGWAMPHAASGIMTEVFTGHAPRLKSVRDPKAPTLGLPHLLVLRATGHLTAEGKPSEAPWLTLMDGVAAYRSLLARNQFVSSPHCCTLLAHYALEWPYLVVALEQVGRALCDWPQLDKPQRMTVLEQLWACGILLLLPAPRMALSAEFLQQHCAIDLGVAIDVAGLLPEAFALPGNLFASSLYNKLPSRHEEVAQQLSAQHDQARAGLFYPDQLALAATAAGAEEQAWASAPFNLSQWLALLTRNLRKVFATLSPAQCLTTDKPMWLTRVDPLDARLSCSKAWTLGAVENLPPSPDLWRGQLLADQLAQQLMTDLLTVLPPRVSLDTRDLTLTALKQPPSQLDASLLHDILQPLSTHSGPDAATLPSWLTLASQLDEGLGQLDALYQGETLLAPQGEQLQLNHLLHAALSACSHAMLLGSDENQYAAISGLLSGLATLDATHTPSLQAGIRTLQASLGAHDESAADHTAAVLAFSNRWQQALAGERARQATLGGDRQALREKLSLIVQDWVAATSVPPHAEVAVMHPPTGCTTRDEHHAELNRLKQRIDGLEQQLNTKDALIHDKETELVRLRKIDRSLERYRLHSANQPPARGPVTGFADIKALANALLGTMDDTNPLSVLETADNFCQGKLEILPSAL
ncbi:hypothetical protein, partial [Craterilacuibacter sp.]|uniref:hypothetical protein n=1 Tax=Craterilacuibacter sp. TaxID=2870909 RepID=UPI003F366471